MASRWHINPLDLMNMPEREMNLLRAMLYADLEDEEEAEAEQRRTQDGGEDTYEPVRRRQPGRAQKRGVITF